MNDLLNHKTALPESGAVIDYAFRLKYGKEWYLFAPGTGENYQSLLRAEFNGLQSIEPPIFASFSEQLTNIVIKVLGCWSRREWTDFMSLRETFLKNLIVYGSDLYRFDTIVTTAHPPKPLELLAIIICYWVPEDLASFIANFDSKRVTIVDTIWDKRTIGFEGVEHVKLAPYSAAMTFARTLMGPSVVNAASITGH